MPDNQADHAGWIRTALETYEGPLLRYAVRLSLGDVERARDAVQDTFLRLCREPRAKVEGHLAQWLYTVCRNRVFEVLRKEQRMTPLSDADLAVRPAADSDPAADAQRRDRVEHILELVAGLPRREQELLRLRFQDNLSYKEISAVTKLSISNVGFLLHTSIRALRRRLEEAEA